MTILRLYQRPTLNHTLRFYHPQGSSSTPLVTSFAAYHSIADPWRCGLTVSITYLESSSALPSLRLSCPRSAHPAYGSLFIGSPGSACRAIIWGLGLRLNRHGGFGLPVSIVRLWKRRRIRVISKAGIVVALRSSDIAMLGKARQN